jgi:type IV fimbrial biogenesis protein FimT
VTQTTTQGFTLLECLIVLFIISFLILLCQTHLSSLVYRVGAQIEAKRLFNTLTYARSAAIKGNRLVFVCPTKNQIDCEQDWSQGYMVFSAIERLRVVQTHPHTQIRSKNASSLLQFSGDGRCLNRTTFHIKTDGLFKVVVYDSGRIRLASP